MFAADNWMHKSNGIQLGLTDSIRCQLPKGYDGTGYWSLTIYALGYADSTYNFKATDANIVKPDTNAGDTTELNKLVSSVEELKKSDYTEKSWNSFETELKEAKDILAKEAPTQAEVDEAIKHLTDAKNALDKLYVYGTANLSYADFYYGELNDVKEDAEINLDVEDKAASYRERGMYDAVSSATTNKYKSFFSSTYSEDNTNGQGGSIIGMKDVNIAVPTSLYENAKKAISDKKECSNKLLEIKNLHVNVEDKEILKGIDLTINKGEIHVIMGPNGSGKTTTANAILSNPLYNKVEGNISFESEDITNLKTDEIARKGVFMSFQLPEEIPGISVTNFLKSAKGKITGKPTKVFEFKDELRKYMEELKMNPEYAGRSLNVGFSGGEKKKNEILQMLVLNPKLAILDETDSGLDVDAIRTVSKGIEMFKNENNAVLIITHNTKILKSLKVDYVHILVNGKIVKTGDQSLAAEIEEEGYSKYKNLV